jgi:hypothetical protein
MHPVHTLQFYFINIHFKIMRPSVPRSSKWFPSFFPQISFQWWYGINSTYCPVRRSFKWEVPYNAFTEYSSKRPALRH